MKKYSGIIISFITTLIFLSIGVYYFLKTNSEEEFFVMTISSLFGVVAYVSWQIERALMEKEKAVKN